MASRSVQVHFSNRTNSTLTLTSDVLSGGIWSIDDAPPETIAAGAENVQFGSESDGFLTGTGATVTYALSAGGNVVLTYENPFAGQFTFGSTPPTGYQCPGSSDGGNNASLTFTLEPLTV